MKRILLTGATGDVGGETLDELLRQGDRYRVRLLLRPSKKNIRFHRSISHLVEVTWGDITSRDDCRKACRDIDACIHLAGVIPPLAWDSPDLSEKINVEGTANLVRAMEEVSPSARFVFTSSISVYGDRLSNPLIYYDDPLRPNPGDYYGKSKMDAEKIVRESSLTWVIFRLAYITTPIKPLNRENMRLLFLMPLDTSVEILESDDTALALVRVLENENLYGRVHNLAGGESCRTTFREYLDRYLSLYGLGKQFFPDQAFSSGGFYCGFYGDTEEVQKELGFQRHTLDDHFRRVRENIHPLVPPLACIFRLPVRAWLMRYSEPLKRKRESFLSDEG
jgi:nucleoside-diphosphate-sugar epimerase